MYTRTKDWHEVSRESRLYIKNRTHPYWVVNLVSGCTCTTGSCLLFRSFVHLDTKLAQSTLLHEVKWRTLHSASLSFSFSRCEIHFSWGVSLFIGHTCILHSILRSILHPRPHPCTLAHPNAHSSLNSHTFISISRITSTIAVTLSIRILNLSSS